MDPRFIVRYTQTFQCAALVAVIMLTSSCAQLLDIEPLPRDFAVRGTATGVLGPVALELRMGGDDELLTVTQEGPFAFETPLPAGASYTVVLADPDVPCALRNQTGVITGAEPSIELTCTGASLASVVVSGIAPAVTLVPGTTTYEVELPLLQQAVTLTAAVATDGDTLTIAGMSVDSGAPSAEITLSLGDNPVDIVVENDLGWERTYRVILRRAGEIAQYAYGKASNSGEDDEFGVSVALSGDTLAVGAHHEDDSSMHSGAVYVFRRSGTTWLQEAYLKASNADAGDSFGFSVALSGDTLAVGAHHEASAARDVGGDQADDSATDSGAVYVFRRDGTTWRQEAYIKASNTGAGDQFGVHVALSGDTLAVGANFEASAARDVGGDQADDSATGSGAVYVFRRDGITWQQEAYVKASNTGAGDQFGVSVALAGDTLAVGARNEDSAAQGVDGNQADDPTTADSGAVYVFRHDGTTWQQEAYLKASNTGAGDQFGVSVALAGDILAVGANFEDSAAQGVDGNQADDPKTANSGAVYVFRRDGTTWQQEAYVKASNTGENDYFGASMALAGDILAIGARLENSAAQGVDGDQADDPTTADSGAVYVFRRSGTTWQQEAYLKASNTGAGDLFGASVTLAGDTLAVGASREDSAAQGVGGNQADDSATRSGAVYIFH